jgi:Flp pilus assembly pilin Flp
MRRPPSTKDRFGPPVRRCVSPVLETNGLEQPPFPPFPADNAPPIKHEMIRLFVPAFRSLLAREEGQSLVEYAFIIALVSIGVITLLSSIGAYPSSVFSHINADF